LGGLKVDVDGADSRTLDNKTVAACKQCVQSGRENGDSGRSAGRKEYEENEDNEDEWRRGNEERDPNLNQTRASEGSKRAHINAREMNK
jgi:hypothetical protein